MSAASPGTPDPAYHAGMRELQDRCDTRLLADRLDEKLSRTAFTAEDRAFIESRPLFFLATADASGHWKFVSPWLANGKHDIAVFATDSLSNSGLLSNSLTIQV